MEDIKKILSNYTAEELEQALMELNAGDGTDAMENMYLNFTVGEGLYGIEIRYVLQIVGMQPINTMPDMEPGMKGYMTLRGNVIPVVSLRLHFGQPEIEYTDRTCIVVVRLDEKEIGLIVDTIQETITIEPANISAPPTAGDHATSPYVHGIAQLDKTRTAILLDAQKLFEHNNF